MKQGSAGQGREYEVRMRMLRAGSRADHRGGAGV